MTAALVQKLSEIRDLKGLVETAVNELGQSLKADCAQILLANPLDPNSAVICEAYSPTGLPSGLKPGSSAAHNLVAENKSSRLNLPLDINGRGFGTLSLSRKTSWLPEEIDSTRLLAGKVGELIRQAQLNDIAQRETFRETFLVEINNLMTYSLGVGDALFMVVNILGKALRCSRCIFVCTDDKNAGWKCYEYWQQDKVKSCQECHWPTNDSALIAQTLSSYVPLRFYEGQANSYLTPAQAELQFSNTRSLLALPLHNDNNIYGCVIIQQCDYRRNWTINEVDTVQSVSDRVAEALAKLPEEKRIHKPIMQLHQRIVAAARTSDGAATASLAQSLKGAFGQQSIRSARETSNTLPTQDSTTVPILMKPGIESATQSGSVIQNDSAIPAIKEELESGSPLQQKESEGGKLDEKKLDGKKLDGKKLDGKTPDGKKLDGKKADGKKGVVTSGESSSAPSIVPVQRKNKSIAPIEDLIEKADTETPDTAVKPSGDAWGDLDSIPTPSTGPVLSGLQGSMLPKVKAQAKRTGSALRASLYKQKLASADSSGDNLIEQKDNSSEDAIAGESEGQAGIEGSKVVAAEKRDGKAGDKGKVAIEGKSKDEARDEDEAKDKADLLMQQQVAKADEKTDREAKQNVDDALSTKTEGKTSSEYIFSIPNLDMRLRGRINGWIAAIEQKDRYLTPHAIQVAEYACALAKAINLPTEEIEQIRLAALVHDVGKLGIAGEILQKADENLDDAELLTTMRHPIDGAELLESSADLAHLAPIVLAHHEEFDGNGYPGGLKGEEIPLAARIIYIANSYHGMISDTKSSKGMSAAAAQEELRKEAGKQYDPALVEPFIGSLHLLAQ